MSTIISTWPFSLNGTKAAAQLLCERASAVDAVTTGIETVELDPSITSVGYGGLPNADGILQLDAALMTSSGQAGAVTAVENLPSAIGLARLVMQKSNHTILTNAGATRFAAECGLQLWSDSSELLTPHAKKRYEQFRAGQVHVQTSGHSAGDMKHTDTVGMIAKDASGVLAAGCATSGMEFKAAGRVGDSAVIGAGLFADETGAAVASGDGDRMLRFCLAFLVVERMKLGDSPDAACMYSVRRVAKDDCECQAAVAAMDSNGNLGAASTHGGFHVAHWEEGGNIGEITLREAPSVGGLSWAHSCI